MATTYGNDQQTSAADLQAVADKLITQLEALYSRKLPKMSKDLDSEKQPVSQKPILYHTMAQTDVYVRYSRDFALGPMWAFGLPQGFDTLAKARWDLHRALDKYITTIHGEQVAFASPPKGPKTNVVTLQDLAAANALSGAQLQRTGSPTLAFIMILSNKKIMQLYAAEKIWGVRLHDALTCKDTLDEKLVEEFIPVRTAQLIRLVEAVDRLPPTIESLEDARKWIVLFQEVVNSLASEVRYLIEFVAGVSATEVTAVIEEDFTAFYWDSERNQAIPG